MQKSLLLKKGYWRLAAFQGTLGLQKGDNICLDIQRPIMHGHEVFWALKNTDRWCLTAFYGTWKPQGNIHTEEN